MAIPWDLIFEVIRQMIENCPNNERRKERLLAAMRSPNRVQKWAFERRLRRAATAPWTGCCSGDEYDSNERQILSAAYEYAANAEDFELEAVCGLSA